MRNVLEADESRVISFSTGTAETRVQLDVWEQIVARLHGRLRFERGRRLGYLGRLRARKECNTQFVLFHGDTACLTRNAKHASSDSIDRYEIMIPLSGQCTINHCGHQTILERGRLMLLDMSKPFYMTHDNPVSAALIACDRSALEGRLPGISQSCGVPPAIKSPIVSTFVSYAESMCYGLDLLEDHEFKCMMAHMLDLSTLMLDGLHDLRSQTTATQHALLHRLKQHIHKHLSEDTLTLAEVANENGISLRYMQKLFQIEGISPSDYLLEARLLRARADLQNGYRRRSIAIIAYKSGFGSASYFSTVYKRRFGCSPRDEMIHRQIQGNEAAY